MTHDLITVECGGPGLKLPAEYQTGTRVRIFNEDNTQSPCECYQDAMEPGDLDGMVFPATKADILIYIHDDVTIHDPNWLERVLSPFENKEVVAVGLGGATGLANRDLYRKSFNIWNMARRGYRSNQTDWKTHGEHCDTLCRVAVLDAFFMAVRRDFLVDVGGWPTQHLTHHCLDLWLACEAARQGKEIWMAGVSCTHHGGGSSTKPGYAQARWLQGGSLELDHLLPHKWLYEEYRDVLPLETT